MCQITSNGGEEDIWQKTVNFATVIPVQMQNENEIRPIKIISVPLIPESAFCSISDCNCFWMIYH